MEFLLDLIQQYGLLIVFLNVFLEQIGLPIPAYPSLVVTGALIGEGNFTFIGLLRTAVIGALLADSFWYFAGRLYGKRVMGKLCRISLSPNSCVKQTESVYLRFGPVALLFCKFIPGFASISSALAGSLGTRPIVFIILDGVGAAIWAGSAIFLGSFFNSEIDQLLAILVEMGKWGAILLASGLAAFVASKWWERYKFIKALRMSRIDVNSLADMLDRGEQPIIIDTRAQNLLEDGWIPGARFVTVENVDSFAAEINTNEFIVLYCSCPNEVTAAKVAKVFINRGYQNVRPLAGGIDAWIAAGFQIQKNNQ